jgi:hypothetical protein
VAVTSNRIGTQPLTTPVRPKRGLHQTFALTPSGRRPHRRSVAARHRRLPALRSLPRQWHRGCFPGGLDPAVGALDVRDAELVDMAVEGIGEAASPRATQMPRSRQSSRPGRPTNALFESPKREHQDRAVAKPAAPLPDDNGNPDAVRRVVALRQCNQTKPPFGQAAWASLPSPPAGALVASLPPRPDEPLDKRRYRRPQSPRQQARR